MTHKPISEMTQQEIDRALTEVEVREDCPDCERENPWSQCKVCNGTGEIVTRPFAPESDKCNSCNGTGSHKRTIKPNKNLISSKIVVTCSDCMGDGMFTFHSWPGFGRCIEGLQRMGKLDEFLYYILDNGAACGETGYIISMVKNHMLNDINYFPALVLEFVRGLK